LQAYLSLTAVVLFPLMGPGMPSRSVFSSVCAYEQGGEFMLKH